METKIWYDNDLTHFLEDEQKMKITSWYLPTFKVRTRQGTERLLWVEIIQKYVGNIEEFPDTWEKLIDKTPIEVVKDLALAVHQFFTSRLSRLVWPKLWSLGELNCWNLDFNPKWVHSHNTDTNFKKWLVFLSNK